MCGVGLLNKSQSGLLNTAKGEPCQAVVQQGKLSSKLVLGVLTKSGSLLLDKLKAIISNAERALTGSMALSFFIPRILGISVATRVV
jgi:hypothetical protein